VLPCSAVLQCSLALSQGDVRGGRELHVTLSGFLIRSCCSLRYCLMCTTSPSPPTTHQKYTAPYFCPARSLVPLSILLAPMTSACSSVTSSLYYYGRHPSRPDDIDSTSIRGCMAFRPRFMSQGRGAAATIGWGEAACVTSNLSGTPPLTTTGLHVWLPCLWLDHLFMFS